MRLIGLLLLAGATGCVNFRAQMIEKHPRGYQMTAKMHPPCTDPPMAMGGFCMKSAEIFEAPLRRVVPLALASWRDSLRSMDAEIERGKKEGSIIIVTTFTDGRREAAANIEATVFRAARWRIEQAAKEGDVYGRFVLPAFDSAIAESLDSADSLQRAHEDGVREALTAARE